MSLDLRLSFTPPPSEPTPEPTSENPLFKDKNQEKAEAAASPPSQLQLAQSPPDFLPAFDAAKTNFRLPVIDLTQAPDSPKAPKPPKEGFKLTDMIPNLAVLDKNGATKNLYDLVSHKTIVIIQQGAVRTNHGLKPGSTRQIQNYETGELEPDYAAFQESGFTIVVLMAIPQKDYQSALRAFDRLEDEYKIKNSQLFCLTPESIEQTPSVHATYVVHKRIVTHAFERKSEQDIIDDAKTLYSFLLFEDLVKEPETRREKKAQLIKLAAEQEKKASEDPDLTQRQSDNESQTQEEAPLERVRKRKRPTLNGR